MHVRSSKLEWVGTDRRDIVSFGRLRLAVAVFSFTESAVFVQPSLC